MMQSRELGEVRGWFCRAEYWMDMGIIVLSKGSCEFWSDAFVTQLEGISTWLLTLIL